MFCDPEIPGDCDPLNPNHTVNEWGLFLWSEGKTVSLVLPGDPAPGTNGSTFIEQDSLLTIKAMNDSGDIAAFLHYDKVGGIYLLSDDKIIPVILYENPILADPETPSLTNPCGINNKGDIVFPGVVKTGLLGLFLAIRGNVPFEINKIEPAIGTKDSKVQLEVTGTGFQPGTNVSFSENGIRVLRTDFKTSTTLLATISITPNVRSGLHDIVIINSVGEESILENGFTIVRE